MTIKRKVGLAILIALSMGIIVTMILSIGIIPSMAIIGFIGLFILGLFWFLDKEEER